MSPDRARDALRVVWTPAVLCTLVVLVAVGSQFLNPALQLQASTTLVYVLVVVGLYTFVGNSGVVSFGHIAFMAIGAYAAALLSIPPIQKSILIPALPHWLGAAQLAPLTAALVGGLLAALLALVVGPAIMRLSGVAASIAMLGLLAVVNVVISQSDSITRGDKTMIGIPLDTGIAMPLGGALAAILIAWAYQRSAAGMRLRASREDEIGARGVGVSIARERTVALILSAFLIGVGGGLFAYLLGAISPDEFYLRMTFTTIVMLVFGGMRSLSGAVLGTLLLSIVAQLLRELEAGVSLGFTTTPPIAGLQLIGLSVIALAVLILLPEGLTGGREIPFPADIAGRLRARHGRQARAARRLAADTQPTKENA